MSHLSPVRSLDVRKPETELPFTFDRPLVMGVLNTTPDSFSDGGRFAKFSEAVDHALLMVASGADIIDVGGESTRPGAAPVTVAQEIDRVVPVIEAVCKATDVLISVDTSSAAVMYASKAAGAGMINDVRALRREGAIEAVAALDLPVCLMHMKGTPETMQNNPHYDDLFREIADFFDERITACLQQGIRRSQIILDPGFGFGKTVAHNMKLLNGLSYFASYELPLLMGLSRKSTLGQLTGRETEDRLAASLAGAMIAAINGAQILRVHDVAETVDALKILQALRDIE